MAIQRTTPGPGRLLSIAAEHKRGLHTSPRDDCARCRAVDVRDLLHGELRLPGDQPIRDAALPHGD